MGLAARPGRGVPAVHDAHGRTAGLGDGAPDRTAVSGLQPPSARPTAPGGNRRRRLLPRACSRSAAAQSPPTLDVVKVPGRPAAEQPVARASGMENAHEHCGTGRNSLTPGY